MRHTGRAAVPRRLYSRLLLPNLSHPGKARTVPSPNDSKADEIAALLDRWRAGDERAFDRLFAIIYGELRSLAGSYLGSERSDHTLQPTALVHEAYLRLARLSGLEAKDRGHFFAIAARAMRRILVDHARRHGAAKRPGVRKRGLEDAATISFERPHHVLQLHDALSELEATHPRAAQIVEQRFFGGQSEHDVAIVLGVSRTTVSRDWRFARLWLYERLR